MQRAVLAALVCTFIVLTASAEQQPAGGGSCAADPYTDSYTDPYNDPYSDPYSAPGELCGEHGSCGVSDTCECDFGHFGAFCDLDYNMCYVSNDCGDHGVCVAGQSGFYVCSCDAGWGGDYCDQDIDECQVENGGCGPAGDVLCINNITPTLPPKCVPRVVLTVDPAYADNVGAVPFVTFTFTFASTPAGITEEDFDASVTPTYNFDATLTWASSSQALLRVALGNSGIAANIASSFLPGDVDGVVATSVRFIGACGVNECWLPFASTNARTCRHNGDGHCFAADATVLPMRCPVGTTKCANVDFMANNKKQEFCEDCAGASWGQCRSGANACALQLSDGSCPAGFHHCNGCSSMPCGAHGTCQPGASAGYTCSCAAGWLGSHCAQRDWCATQPCQNGGVCSNGQNGYMCTCPVPWGGATCEVNLDGDECSPDPCHHGTCIDGVMSFTCSCDAGYGGQLCNVDIDDCSGNPCQHGSCTDGLNSYTCSCQTGWSGDNCDADVDECAGAHGCEHGCVNTDGGFSCTCPAGLSLNGDGLTCSDQTDDCGGADCGFGTCIDGVDSYSCSCDQGWTGSACNQDVNECASGNGGCQEVCTNTAGSFTCDCSTPGFELGNDGTSCLDTVDSCEVANCNHGTCVDGHNSFTCTCDAGWTGAACATDINECATGNHNCQDLCINQPGGFTCGCSSGTTLNGDGISCDDVDDCTVNPCLHGGECTDAGVNAFTCSCEPGYSGTTCQVVESCGTCAAGTSGLCLYDGACSQYIPSTQICTPGASPCRPPVQLPASSTCSGCALLSSGPCKSGDGTCFAYQTPAAGQCPAGTISCVALTPSQVQLQNSAGMGLYTLELTGITEADLLREDTRAALQRAVAAVLGVDASRVTILSVTAVEVAAARRRLSAVRHLSAARAVVTFSVVSDDPQSDAVALTSAVKRGSLNAAFASQGVQASAVTISGQTLAPLPPSNLPGAGQEAGTGATGNSPASGSSSAVLIIVVVVAAVAVLAVAAVLIRRRRRSARVQSVNVTTVQRPVKLRTAF